MSLVSNERLMWYKVKGIDLSRFCLLCKRVNSELYTLYMLYQIGEYEYQLFNYTNTVHLDYAHESKNELRLSIHQALNFVLHDEILNKDPVLTINEFDPFYFKNMITIAVHPFTIEDFHKKEDVVRYILLHV